MDEIHVPAKVLLIGEYSVIEGGIALLAALKPGYGFEKSLRAPKPHEESPLGRYLAQSAQFVSFGLKDEGLGAGMGTSTAELIAGACLVHGKRPETLPLWQWYKRQFPSASGADLAVQLEALRTKQSLFRVEGTQIESFKKSALLAQILIFRSPSEDKLKTHEALEKKRPALDLQRMNEWVKKIEAGFAENKLQDLLAFTEFAQYLSSLGLETPRAQKIREAFRDDSSVLAAKGCGAGLNDVFLVVKKNLALTEEGILEIARKNRLSYLGTLEEHLW